MYEVSNNGEYWSDYEKDIYYNDPFKEWSYVRKKEMCNKSTAYNAATTEVGTAVPGAFYWNTIGNTANYAPPKCVGVPKKEEGNNPMRYDTVTVAPSISIEAGATEAATQRAYLTKRLDSLIRSFDYGEKYREIRKQFNIDAPTAPKNFREMLAAIKDDKYTIDPKVEKRLDRHLEDVASCEYYDSDCEYDFDDRYYFGMTEGIIWTDFPKADFKAFTAAIETAKKKSQDVKDAIAIMDPKDALEALKAFEAWMPTKETDTAQ